MTDLLLHDLADVSGTRTPDPDRIHRRAHTLRVRRRARVASGVGALATVFLVGGAVLAPHGGPGSVDAAAADVFIAAGQAAGEQPGGWPDAAYWRVEAEIAAYGEQPRVRTTWLAHHGESVFQDPHPDFTGGLGGQLAPVGEDGVRTETLGSYVFGTGVDAVDWDGLYALPTDPTELERVLRDGIDGRGPDDDTELWEIVKSMLWGTPAPPALREALWRVAATIPYVEVSGPATDAAGRAGVALERLVPDSGWGLERVIVDPEGGRILQIEGYSLDRSASWRTTFLEQGPADSAPPADLPRCGPGSEPERPC